MEQKMNMAQMTEGNHAKLGNYRILGLSVPVFALFSVIVATAVYLEVLPTGLVGALPLMMILGAILDWQ
jgi:Na+/citrate or Na+/malate symporter